MQIASGIPVDIMPGTTDPANFAMPQQVSVTLITSCYHISIVRIKLLLT